jgi:hypothetical protein
MSVRSLTLLVLAAASAGPARAQDGDSEQRIALAWHKVSGVAIDFQRVAERSDAVRRVSNFDRPEALAAEIRRLEGLLAAARETEEFTMQVNDRIAEYDHASGEFSITLFEPGYFIPVEALGQQYQVVFANAASARAIPMPREEARDFDARLNAMGRGVLTEVRFRVIGTGDPAGAVGGERVVRAELLAARVLDRAGRVLHTATVASAAAIAAAAPVLDLHRADVAGLRVGVAGKDLEATLARLFGKADRGSRSQSHHPAIAATLEVNPLGCMNLPGRREARPGTVCVIAQLDGDDVVRAVRIERIFPPLAAEAVRRAVVAKYGPVGGPGLSWGPEVDRRFGAMRALTASVAAHQSMLGAGANRIPDVKVTLTLVDAEWASRQPK